MARDLQNMGRGVKRKATATTEPSCMVPMPAADRHTCIATAAQVLGHRALRWVGEKVTCCMASGRCCHDCRDGAA